MRLGIRLTKSRKTVFVFLLPSLTVDIVPYALETVLTSTQHDRPYLLSTEILASMKMT